MMKPYSPKGILRTVVCAGLLGLALPLGAQTAEYVSQVWSPDLGDGRFKNPIIHADYSDPDVCAVGNDFYMTASSFACVPGLPILHSKDLVNWKIVNHALKYLRKSVRKEALSAQADLTSIPDIPEAQLEVADIPEHVIQEMIRRLPDGYRTIFNLFVFEDKTHKEIAALLGIKENSSASQLHRAKAMLAKWITEYRSRYER